ncbi:MAG: rRNA adenine N-6-methyltransferase family protein, partial [Candidatus Azambacteria bacterium]|nr:rRNA adenine N-6-methyltransferase family protein [Candidatus Azambacteria bacterium]
PPPSPPTGRIRRARPELMVLMIQKEVAQRICARPRLLRQLGGYGGQAPMNLLAVSVQFFADAKIIGYVPAEAFWPKPKVDSAIIKIVPKRSKRNDCFKPIGLKQSFAFFRIVKAGFSQPRKQLIGNLIKKLPNKDGKITKEKLLEIFKKISIPERARAENLSLEQWVSLATSLRLTTQRK